MCGFLFMCSGDNVANNPGIDLALIAQTARRSYAECVAGSASQAPWWTAVIITASSERQADWYRWELHRRQERGRVPAGTRYLVVPDVGDQRIGSGGATINALRVLATETLFKESGGRGVSLANWWTRQRVLVIHSGGDSRRLPQYTLSGKLFSSLPVKTPWGETSTVLMKPWPFPRVGREDAHGPGGGVRRRAAHLRWKGSELEHRGHQWVAMRQPAELGTRHGVM